MQSTSRPLSSYETIHSGVRTQQAHPKSQGSRQQHQGAEPNEEGGQPATGGDDREGHAGGKSASAELVARKEGSYRQGNVCSY